MWSRVVMEQWIFGSISGVQGLPKSSCETMVFAGLLLPSDYFMYSAESYFVASGSHYKMVWNAQFCPGISCRPFLMPLNDRLWMKVRCLQGCSSGSGYGIWFSSRSNLSEARLVIIKIIYTPAIVLQQLLIRACIERNPGPAMAIRDGLHDLLELVGYKHPEEPHFSWILKTQTLTIVNLGTTSSPFFLCVAEVLVFFSALRVG